MSYLVLARKWRPQLFEDLVGQEHVSRTLGNSIRSGRVHHAFLFTGARGVGKTSAARILAKALNCEQGPTVTPCNVCPACLEITAGQGVDVFEIDGASNTGVDDVRDLRENIRYLPAKSNYKIFIIDEVHMLSINAFNALLKTLEEPPAHAKFIFATTEPHKIPITILSRCQRFDFRKIDINKLVHRLREIVTAEGMEISDRALMLIARRGEGSMRDALSTLDQVIAFCGDQVGDEDVQALLGLVDRRLLFAAAEGVLRRDARACLDAVCKIDELGHSFRQFCQELVELFRGLVLCRVLDEPGDLLPMTTDEITELRALAATVEPEELHRAVTALIHVESDLAQATFPRLALEMALIRLATLPPGRDIAMLLHKLEQLECRLGSGGVTTLPRSSPPPLPVAPGAAPPPGGPPPKKAEAPPSATNSAKSWVGLVEHVKSRRRPLIASLLEHASPMSLPPEVLEVGLASGSFQLAQLQDEDNRNALAELANEYFGMAVQVKVTARNKDVAAPLSLNEERHTRETDRKKRLRDDALEHPMVKKALDIFAGKVESVKAIDKGFV
ncbi:MAG: DNA polymerase III subunit gamma/tau [Desulfuromonadales bacterium]|nr:DNA polymerase III subunit gamma/tau [Desulfuromonadales bacterium]MDT8424204.1 DNA polymerase III subunit gamma/tau [Desulfuromonadales bacterium]